ncbi:MAG: lamin tail domain-containing protein [Caldilineaceae bacterium]|nr:lamin tail domain-containing protein [Caldilineaceae bacterium]
MRRRYPPVLFTFSPSRTLLLLSLLGLSLLYGIISGEPSQAQTIPPATMLPTAIATASVPPSPTATVLPADTPTPSATATPPPTPTATPIPRLLITEFLANPGAVSDEVGEWLELFNADSMSVNLRGWQLADLGSDRHTIEADIVLAPGQYLVLARNRDTAVNGGVLASYQYANLTLANGSDELRLLAPDGTTVDLVQWGEGHPLNITAGASLQRTVLDDSSAWITSQVRWAGSSGDLGTPGSAYQPPAAGPATATPTLAPHATVATPTPTPIGPQWPQTTAPSPLVIDEVLYRGSDAEFVVLRNEGDEAVDLSGWAIGDEETPGAGEGIYALPPGYLLLPGARFVIARDGRSFHGTWGEHAHAEFGSADEATPDLARLRTLATGQWALNDSGDEVILLNPNRAVADAVVFADGAYQTLAVQGPLSAPTGYSLQRVPGARFVDHVDQRHRFLYAPPAPFHSVALPNAQAAAAQPLTDAGLALWGSLGATSNFSADGTAPPHYLYHAAAANGLDFVAIADPTSAPPWQPTAAVLVLPAWRWQWEDDAAIVYNQWPQPELDRDGLLRATDAGQTPPQWVDGAYPTAHEIAAIAADQITAPDTLKTLYRAWRTANAPLLPAGNAGPPEPGRVPPTPRYTGLLVSAHEVTAIQEALYARRGWLTNRPGLWLTLATERQGNVEAWMGTAIAAENSVTVRIDYGDRAQESAGLTLWQDDRPLLQLDQPTGARRWTVTVPTIPGTFLYAVATQADGDFAITAPLYVQPSQEKSVWLNEVLPAPWADHNGDGVVSTDDEYIELYNSSPSPRSLAGWQLLDATAAAGSGRAYTFGSGQVIPGQSWLVLYRTASRISLNNEAEVVILRNADGEEIDRIAWQLRPDGGASLSRIGDGNGTWQEGNPTPGQANALLTDDRGGTPGSSSTSGPTPRDNDDDNHTGNDLPPPVQLDPTYGQAGGPPASIAQSKLAGLEADVEFYAIVVAPPNLFNASIFVADPAPDPRNGPYAGIGINVYLQRAAYPDLQEGDRVRVRGVLKSFRGEMELQLHDGTAIQRVGTGPLLLPLPVAGLEIGESLEGRLVTFRGIVSGWQGDSIYLSDPAHPEAEAVRVTVRSSTGWRRPYVNRGERWQATGIVSQFAHEAPWNGGYRVLVRYEEDLVRVHE